MSERYRQFLYPDISEGGVITAYATTPDDSEDDLNDIMAWMEVVTGPGKHIGLYFGVPGYATVEEYHQVVEEYRETLARVEEGMAVVKRFLDWVEKDAEQLMERHKLWWKEYEE